MICHLTELKSLFYKLTLTCSLLLIATNSWSAGSDSAQSKQTTINGAIFNYQEQGVGTPVVFVHGCCSDYRAWTVSERQSHPSIGSLRSTFVIMGQALRPTTARSTRSQRMSMMSPHSFRA